MPSKAYRAERDDQLFDAVERARKLLFFDKATGVPKRLREAWAILDGCRQSDADPQNLRAAAALIRGCAIDLMKAAANLDQTGGASGRESARLRTAAAKLRPRKARASLVFTDDDGRRWRVYDWTVIAGHKYRRSPGEQSTEYRGFFNEATGERREYRFSDEKTPRLLSDHLLKQQLAEARVLPPRGRADQLAK
jgi:hypothetical protein